MEKVVINSFAEFETFVGKGLGVSDFHTITQDQINLFADATLDHQWIHTQPERALKESPYGTTIADGYLSRCILPTRRRQVVDVNSIKRLVIWRVEKLRYN